jgi:hypothetical protein
MTTVYQSASADYNPQPQRFISEDRIAYRGGDSNLSVYGFNASTMFVDPSGLDGADSPSLDSLLGKPLSVSRFGSFNPYRDRIR